MEMVQLSCHGGRVKGIPRSRGTGCSGSSAVNEGKRKTNTGSSSSGGSVSRRSGLLVRGQALLGEDDFVDTLAEHLRKKQGHHRYPPEPAVFNTAGSDKAAARCNEERSAEAENEVA